MPPSSHCSPALGCVINQFGYRVMFATAAAVMIAAAVAYAAWEGDLALRRRPVAEQT